MNILERFHLALSYLEKSRRELDKWERVRSLRMVDLTQFDLVRDRYIRHVKQAQELVNVIRNSQRESLTVLDDEIRNLRRAQSKLMEAITAGSVKPKQANKQNRNIALELERLEEARDWADLISRAENTKVFAGPIDVPFTEYTKLLDIDDPNEVPEPEPVKKPVNPRNVLLMVVGGLLLWAGWSYYETLGHLRVQMKVENNKQVVQAVCENSGKRGIRLIVPWENGVPDDGSVEQLHGRTFGARVYVKEKGSDRFQILPETTGFWQVDGEDHTNGGVVNLSPDEKVLVTLNTLELRKSGVLADQVRLEFTRHGGRVVERYDAILP